MQSLTRLGLKNSARAISTHVTTIPGDGIGPEILRLTKDVINATNAPVKFDHHPISEIQGFTEDEYNNTLASLSSTKVGLKGFMLAGRKYDINDQQTLSMRMKKELDIFASVVHIKSFEGISTKHKNLDFIVIRETTEGEYCGEEHECIPGVVESLKVMTKLKCERIARFAFDYAMRHNRKRVTCVHKANIMKLGDGLFMRTCEEIAQLYPTIEYNDLIVDNTCMQMVSKPHQFDVLVTPNLYGNIIQNIGAGMIGGTGVLAGASYSSNIALFEPGARYTFQSGAGLDTANPTAMFQTAGNMLHHIGFVQHGIAVKEAVRRVIKTGKFTTKDVGGYCSTTDFTANVINYIKPVVPVAYNPDFHTIGKSDKNMNH